MDTQVVGLQWVTEVKYKEFKQNELVGIDDMMPIMLWTCYFLLAQGYGIIENLLLQDNKSSILLEQNGKASSSKLMRHIKLQYFFYHRFCEHEKIQNWAVSHQEGNG
jgi:hypothetical protein